jgi:hypothetical protein
VSECTFYLFEPFELCNDSCGCPGVATIYAIAQQRTEAYTFDLIQFGKEQMHFDLTHAWHPQQAADNSLPTAMDQGRAGFCAF